MVISSQKGFMIIDFMSDDFDVTFNLPSTCECFKKSPPTNTYKHPLLEQTYYLLPLSSLVGRRRLRLGSSQVVSCCVYEMPKQYRQWIMKGNNQICFIIGQLRVFISRYLPRSLLLLGILMDGTWYS